MTNIIQFHPYMEYKTKRNLKKKKQPKQKQTHRCRQQIGDYQRKKGWRGGQNS